MNARSTAPTAAAAAGAGDSLPFCGDAVGADGTALTPGAADGAAGSKWRAGPTQGGVAMLSSHRPVRSDLRTKSGARGFFYRVGGRVSEEKKTCKSTNK
jgi:hypothetical protein